MNGVSLVMATIGRANEVRRFVQYLQSQSFGRYELIVVDQNPDDRLADILAQAASAGVCVRHMRQSEPNQCIARNLGLSVAAYDVVAFPDDDCWYEPQTLALVAERLSGPDSLGGVIIRWAELDPLAGEARLLDMERLRSFREVDASAIAQFFRTSLVQRIGGFDASFGLHSWFGGAEETDLMFRVMAEGLPIAYVPEAIVHHRLGAPPDIPIARAFRSVRSRARGTGALYAKHGLDAHVVARGVVAPLIRAVAKVHKPGIAATEVATCLGRLEGYLGWKAKARCAS